MLNLFKKHHLSLSFDECILLEHILMNYISDQTFRFVNITDGIDDDPGDETIYNINTIQTDLQLANSIFIRISKSIKGDLKNYED